eukprot:CAMPEP_0172631778 /NCGR_PEP_ID=MMETSP1068-20121228/181013_1 /TAXON_ID=35684 /ORGANISM="Pseudopedinella elastica, Strain CCMP716" /LENGTH=86 /DNA_ID=CAMNT_0013443011 /DNA_START=82 /DNA_END=342 /DNA_ORIENTATION=+
MSSTSTLKLSDHFPRVEKPCSKVATKFFNCFTVEGKMNAPEDIEAGSRGLEKCQGLMTAYDKCMVRVLSKKPPAELYRVQDEYRVR